MKATIRSKTTNVVEFPDIEICRRCGASMQLTHHELCESRDGTPTDLDDATVRRLIQQEHPGMRLFSGAPVIAEEIEAKSLSGPSEWLLRTSASSADALSADFRKNHATNWRAQGCCIAVESRPFNSSN